MTDKTKIAITSRHSHELSSNISVDNVTYHVQTEDMGRKSCKIITNVFLKGEIIASRKSDYAHLIKIKDLDARLTDLMDKHHKSVIAGFVADKSKKQKLKAEYFSEVQQLLRRGKGRQALDILREGLESYPTDAFLLSYYGCLIAIVENKTKDGITICENAIKALDTSMPFGSEFFYPIFYLNLGRAYLKAGKKAEAIKAFQQGLKSDPENNDIQWEMKKLGSRKKPPVPFLRRGNPINKYIGMLLGKPSK
ncbi:MAG: tetratricopeptide repeat protein [Nitrospirae bacterium]|nr:tetratricopeptide repeat protein [Nitrospirota bacterium]